MARQLTEEQREKERKYNRQYRQKNREKVNARTRVWYQRNKQRMREYQRSYYREHKERIQARWKLHRKEWDRNYRERHKEQLRQKSKRFYLEHEQPKLAQIKIATFTHYGGNPPRCSCCGETRMEFLTIEHLNGGGRKERARLKKQGFHFYEHLMKNEFPVGYGVLCMNCNFSKGHWGYCPHQKEQLPDLLVK